MGVLEGLGQLGEVYVRVLEGLGQLHVASVRKNYSDNYTVEPPRSGQSRPNSVRISEFHLVSHAKPVKRTKFLLSEIRTLGRHVYEYHARFYRQFLLFFIMLNIFTITSINNIC